MVGVEKGRRRRTTSNGRTVEKIFAVKMGARSEKIAIATRRVPIDVAGAGFGDETLDDASAAVGTRGRR